MTSPISPWAQRIQQLVAFTIAGNDYKPDVSTARVNSSLSYFSMCTAKFLQQMEQDIPKENPWVASLMLYICLGDHKPDEVYRESTEFEAGKCIGQALRAGWGIADMLQAIEWQKEAMPYYPTTQQWASIFEVEPDVIVAAQQTLVPHVVDTLNATEKTAWDVACSLDAPFQYWASQIGQGAAMETTPLPELDMPT